MVLGTVTQSERGSNGVTGKRLGTKMKEVMNAASELQRLFNVLGRPSLASSWIQASGDLCRNRELLLTLAGWKARRLKLYARADGTGELGHRTACSRHPEVLEMTKAYTFHQTC